MLQYPLRTKTVKAMCTAMCPLSSPNVEYFSKKEVGQEPFIQMYLRSHRGTALDVEGIFRLSGSAKRIKELQLAFDSPPRYGKGLDWTGYTVHDAANILRRYLNMLPQPIVPHEKYEQFRDPLRSHQAQAVGDMEAQAQSVGVFDPDAAIGAYQKLITELPPLNRQLLLYILDLLAVFAAKSELNRMTSPNLAAIFQPGMLSHPGHDMVPAQYRLSQDVIIFLIVNQDHFLVGMRGTAADADTVREIQKGSPRLPNTPPRTSQAGLGRSASNASAGADSIRRQGGLRRNVSVSSRGSRASSNVPSPGSPAIGSPLVTTASGTGVHRSNTVPSQKSPGIPSGRFRNAEATTPASSKLAPSGQLAPAARSLSPGSKLADTAAPPRSPETRAPVTAVPTTPTADNSGVLNTVPETKGFDIRASSREKAPSSAERLSLRTPDHGVTTTISSGNSKSPNRERINFFSKSPSSENERMKDDRKPKKLRKKRMPDSSPNASAQSSTLSLHDSPSSPTAFYTPMPTPGMGTQLPNDQLSAAPPTFSTIDASPSSELAPRIGELDKLSAFHISQAGSASAGSPALKPSDSPPGSMHSKASMTEESELEHGDDGTSENTKEKKHRWRLSSSTAKPKSEPRAVTPSGPRLGSSTLAERSVTSVISQGRPRKSTTNDTLTTQTGTEASTSSGLHQSSTESTTSKEPFTVKEKDSSPEDEKKKGPMSWIKGKVAKAKEKKEEREAEKERAKSPPHNGSEHATSKHSLNAVAQEGLSTRGRSTDAIAEVSTEEEAQTSAPLSK